MVPTQLLLTRMERRFVTVGFVGTLILLVVTLPLGIEGCASRQSGWGAPPPPVLILPKPTLIPKLIAAFQDGKASVSVKKGPPLGWVGTPPLEINGLGWAPAYEDGFHRYGDHQRGFLVGQKHVGHGVNHGVNYASHFANYDIGPFPVPHDFGIN